MAKNPTEIMEIFASYDLTRCAWSAAQLVGCDPKTVQRYVDLRDAGFDLFRHMPRPRLIDPYLEKVEELVDDSHGKIRADVVHDRLRAMGFSGNERTTRRAVAAAKVAYRPWCRSLASGCSSTGRTVPGWGSARASCSAPGWPGRATGWCCRPETASGVPFRPA